MVNKTANDRERKQYLKVTYCGDTVELEAAEA